MLTCSGLHGTGVDKVWEQVLAHRESLGEQGLADKRADQQLDFTWALVRDVLDQRLRRSPGVKAIRDDVRRELLAGETHGTPGRRPPGRGLRRGRADERNRSRWNERRRIALVRRDVAFVPTPRIRRCCAT